MLDHVVGVGLRLSYGFGTVHIRGPAIDQVDRAVVDRVHLNPSVLERGLVKPEVPLELFLISQRRGAQSCASGLGDLGDLMERARADADRPGGGADAAVGLRAEGLDRATASVFSASCSINSRRSRAALTRLMSGMHSPVLATATMGAGRARRVFGAPSGCRVRGSAMRARRGFRRRAGAGTL